MITRELKISKLLEQFPQTLDVLLEASPHFAKLKNNFFRKALAGRVNIEQAAGIAGVPLDDLLLNLNSAIGAGKEFNSSLKTMQTPSIEAASISSRPALLEKIAKEKIVDLDVRNDIASGNDPLKKIMGAVKQLEEEQVLHLINSFEPVPLYTVLKNKGFEHWTEIENGVWNIYFYKSGKNENKVINAESSSTNICINGTEKIIEIDVRGLEPPEPMVRVLEAIVKMKDDEVLLVHHHREPVMLYEKLHERGFGALCNKLEENHFKIIIKKMKAES